ncbi:hypothetical protein DAPK24_040950 [Pichia kluyveri]|uniref:F-box domain-containing protein n=1 Tax=Pichia kluyveri TaxID=36015 RepID=A0AAV5R935_PICKL|nr:hypothetical protein DAPK24_040950 [Pichia kluyveri]
MTKLQLSTKLSTNTIDEIFNKLTNDDNLNDLTKQVLLRNKDSFTSIITNEQFFKRNEFSQKRKWVSNFFKIGGNNNRDEVFGSQGMDYVDCDYFGLKYDDIESNEFDLDNKVWD